MTTSVQSEPRTAKATRAAQMAAQRKRADYLRDRGWICVAPGSDLHGVISRDYLDENERSA
jgi:hypothetical protein